MPNVLAGIFVINILRWLLLNRIFPLYFPFFDAAGSAGDQLLTLHLKNGGCEFFRDLSGGENTPFHDLNPPYHEVSVLMMRFYCIANPAGRSIIPT